MKDKHQTLTAAITALKPALWTEYNPSEYDHPETLVGCGTGDRNVEIIYMDNVTLLQENGMVHNGRTGFVWNNDKNWVAKIATTVCEWLQ